MGHKAMGVGGAAADAGTEPATAAEPVEAASPARLDAAEAAKVAETLQALAAPSRLLILTALRQGPRSVGEIVETVGLSQSAVSHQLRLLRNLGLVTATRDGRSISYALYDHHVAQLLDQAVHHIDHLRLGLSDS